MTKDNSEAADAGRGKAIAKPLLSGEAVGGGKLSPCYGNEALAKAIRKVEALHEGSFQEGVRRPDYGPTIKRGSEYVKYPNYAKSYEVCIREVVGDDLIAVILNCLFTAGYCVMHDYADRVLGTVASEDGA